MSKEEIKERQRDMVRAGFNIAVDGVRGPQTEKAEEMYWASLEPDYPVWLTELGKQYGLHEVRNKEALTEWLASDGGLLGDPEEFPWCGDAIDTAIRNTLYDEPFDPGLRKNVYWARNWLYFGERTHIALGAIVVLSRSGGGGHVAAVVGQDTRRGMIYIRGGNQNNRICDSWVYTDRVLGYRKPVTWKYPLKPAPNLDSAGRGVSTNEG